MNGDITSAIPSRAQRRADSFGFRLKLAYSTGSMVETVVGNALTVFLLFYVTAVCGLPGALAGAALAVGLVVDAVAEPFIGSISDGLHSRLGRRLPMMLIGLPLTLISFVLIFSLPSGLSEAALFLVLAGLSVCLRMATSIFNLPYLAVGAEVSDDHKVRSSIATWRWGLGILAALVCVSVAFVIFFKGPTGLSNRAAYGSFAIAVSIMLLIPGLLSMRAVYLTRDRQHLPSADDRNLIHRLWVEVNEIFRNPSFRLLFFSALLLFVGAGVNTTLGLHANTFFWRLAPDQVQMVTLASFVGLLVGAPLAAPIVSLMEKRIALMAGLFGIVLCTATPATLRLAGLLPLQGQDLAFALAGVAALNGALITLVAIALVSMLADAADEHEHLFGARREGLYFAGWSFASKAANGGGTLIAGVIIQLIGFPTHISSSADVAASLPVSVTKWLGFYYGPGAAMLLLISGLMISWYRLNRAAHARILYELTERRAGLTAAAD